MYMDGYRCILAGKVQARIDIIAACMHGLQCKYTKRSALSVSLTP